MARPAGYGLTSYIRYHHHIKFQEFIPHQERQLTPNLLMTSSRGYISPCTHWKAMFQILITTTFSFLPSIPSSQGIRPITIDELSEAVNFLQLGRCPNYSAELKKKQQKKQFSKVALNSSIGLHSDVQVLLPLFELTTPTLTISHSTAPLDMVVL